MRWLRWAVATLLAVATVGSAQEVSKPEELKRMYDEALGQLKAAQDRKNELAKENERLTAKVDELQKDLAAAQAEAQDLKKQVAENADKTFYLRSFHAAWEQFMRQHPEMMAPWRAFIEDGTLSGPETTPQLIDPHWPLSAQG